VLRVANANFYVDVAVFFDQFNPRYYYSAQTADPMAYTNGGIGQMLVAANAQTTSIIYSDSDCHVAAELSGQVSAFDLDIAQPPNIFQMPAEGNCPAVTLTGGESQLQTLLDNNINVKVCVGNTQDNLPVFLNGRTVTGGRINDCVLACWLQLRAQEVLFNTDLASRGAQDGTEEGYQIKINAVSAFFRTAQRRGLISGDRFNEVEDQQNGYRIVARPFSEISASEFSSGEPFCFAVETFSPGVQEGSCLEINLFL